MNPAILAMLQRYNCISARDYENALKEIIQEIGLLGLWRAKFFEHAAFYGGTALRILYGLDRFSEDLNFSLLKPNHQFGLEPYLKAIETELNGIGFSVSVTKKEKSIQTAIESAFIKANTKEYLLKIEIPDLLAQRVQKNSLMTIKIEVDTDPPPGFETEAKVLLQPIPFSVNTYKKPDLFAGKLHAILQRDWRGRIKGRDYYDFVWYISRDTPVRLAHLEQRLRQSGGWKENRPLELADLLALLSKKFAEVDLKTAKEDILPFLRDSAAVDLWSREFFESLLPRIKVIA